MTSHDDHMWEMCHHVAISVPYHLGKEQHNNSFCVQLVSVVVDLWHQKCAGVGSDFTSLTINFNWHLPTNFSFARSSVVRINVVLLQRTEVILAQIDSTFQKVNCADRNGKTT